MFIDARKAHLNPKCEEDVYIELPEESGCPKGMCGKLDFWLYGFRPAAAAWEQLYASKLEEVGFVRGMSCGVVFYHQGRDISLAVHADDFTFCGVGELIFFGSNNCYPLGLKSKSEACWVLMKRMIKKSLYLARLSDGPKMV